MWTKKDAMEAAARGEGCLGKARDDEPVFIIVGDDITMASVIRDWAYRVERMYGLRKELVPAKVAEARKFANEVIEWQQQNRKTVKAPD